MDFNNKKEHVNNHCLQCAYCVKHYANLHGTFYLVQGCLHCVNSNLSLKESKMRISNRIRCEYWRNEQLQVDKREKDIKTFLMQTAEKLNEIAQILTEDKNRNEKKE